MKNNTGKYRNCLRLFEISSEYNFQKFIFLLYNIELSDYNFNRVWWHHMDKKLNITVGKCSE